MEGGFNDLLLVFRLEGRRSLSPPFSIEGIVYENLWFP